MCTDHRQVSDRTSSVCRSVVRSTDFGRKRGITWLNMLNDQSAGLAAQVLRGTPRDSLHTVDVVLSQQGGKVPEAIISDTGSYSDIVFGLLHLIGRQYRPELANLPDQRLWRVDPNADYGPLDRVARGRINVEKITRHWDDMCRIAVSLHSYVVTAHEVTRMISRDGSPTSLGLATAHFRADLQDHPHPAVGRRRTVPARGPWPEKPRGRTPRPGPAHLPRQEG
jgi:TnpA family transposase